MKKHSNIGLFGFGVVGEGFFHLLSESKSSTAKISRICVKNIEKKRSISNPYFTDNPSEIIDDPSIDIVVEVINDADTAFRIVKSALQNGKNVISANKKMISQNLEELIQLANDNNVSLLYEAAVGGSIPIIKNLNSYYNDDEIEGIEGIINGSTNFVLDLMTNNSESLPTALKKAQDLGFAESDPTQDIEGFDAASKLKILAKHSFGVPLNDSHIIRKGICSIKIDDIKFAAKNNLKIKLLAHASVQNGKISAYVLPHFVGNDSQFYRVNGEFNAINIHCKIAGTQTLMGKGAGRFPTALAVLTDLSALQRNEAYTYKSTINPCPKNDTIRAYLSFPATQSPNESDFIQVLSRNEENKVCQWLVDLQINALEDSSWFQNTQVSTIFFHSSVSYQHEIIDAKEVKKICL